MITTIASELVEALFSEDVKETQEELSSSGISMHEASNNENLQEQQSSIPLEADIVYPGMRYACKICSRTYSKKRNLASHMHIHNPHWRRFQCHQCPMSYTAKGSLPDIPHPDSSQRPQSGGV